MRGHLGRMVAVLAVVVTWAVCESQAQAQVYVCVPNNMSAWRPIAYSVNNVPQNRLAAGSPCRLHTSGPQGVRVCFNNGHPTDPQRRCVDATPGVWAFRTRDRRLALERISNVPCASCSVSLLPNGLTSPLSCPNCVVGNR